MENAKIISLLQEAMNKDYDNMCNSVKNGNEIQERIYAYSFNRLAMLLIIIDNYLEEIADGEEI